MGKEGQERVKKLKAAGGASSGGLGAVQADGREGLGVGFHPGTSSELLQH